MNTGDILGIISILVALIAIPITFIIGRRTRQIPDLRCCIDFDVILKPDEKLLDQGLTMTVGDKAINSISRTRIAFWNHRGDTVRLEDIVSSDPLRIKFAEGDTPLQARTLSSSREQTNLRTSIDPSNHDSISVAFDFLDAGDGAVFEIVQEGTDPPDIDGTVRGVKRIRRVQPTKLGPSELEQISVRWWRSGRIRRSAFLLIICALLVVVLVTAIISTAHPGTNHPVLINYGDYNLSTFQGQQNFSTAVQSEVQPIGLSGEVVGILIVTLALLATIRALYKRLVQRIPRSIVALRYRTPSKTPSNLGKWASPRSVDTSP